MFKTRIQLIIAIASIAMIVSGCTVSVDPQGHIEIPNWLKLVATPITIIIRTVNYHVLEPIGVKSFGLAIVIVNLLVAVAFLPIRKRQIYSSYVQDQISHYIHNKYARTVGYNKNAMAEKQFQLYKINEVNPLGGCAFSLVELVILTGMYMAVASLLQELQEPFLWIPSLAYPSLGVTPKWLLPLSYSHLTSSQVLPYLVLPGVYTAVRVGSILFRRRGLVRYTTSQWIMDVGAPALTALLGSYVTLVVPSAMTLYWVISIITSSISTAILNRNLRLVTLGDEPVFYPKDICELFGLQGQVSGNATGGHESVFYPEDVHEVFGPQDRDRAVL